MYEALRNPRLNAAVLGLLQGVPQGLSLPDQKLFASAGMDQNVWLFTCLGLVVPSLLILASHFTKRRQPRWWAKVTEYVNPYHMMFWGGLSLALSGAYALQRAEARQQVTQGSRSPAPAVWAF
jgi:hypothetical protein